jgi:hypothetical protein
MSLNADNAGSLVAREMLASASCANTAAATSGAGFWVDTQDLDGTIAVIANIGAVAGSIAGKLQSATDANGTGAADIAGATFPAVSTPNGSTTIVISKNQMANRYLGFVGTIVTGPVIVGVLAVGSKKYS